MNAADNIMQRIVDMIINPILLGLMAFAFLVFVYGLVQFMWNLNEGGDNKEGKSHMLWGIVGMLIMISVYGIIAMIDNTLGLDFTNPDPSRANNISGPQLFR